MAPDRKDKQVSTPCLSRDIRQTVNLFSEIPTLVVDSPPEGVNLTGCVLEKETGHCCIDKVDQVSSPVTDPVLECLTHHEEVCHTSYVTEFVPTEEKVRRLAVMVEIFDVSAELRSVRESTRRNVGSS